MKLSLLVAGMLVLACTALAPAAETVVRVQGDKLCVTIPGGLDLRCSNFTLSAQGSVPAVFSVAGGDVRIDSGGIAVKASVFRFGGPATKAAATGGSQS